MERERGTGPGWLLTESLVLFLSLSGSGDGSAVTYGPVKETAAPSLTVSKLCAL